MHTDLIDAVNWAIDNKIADPKKIAILGGSYGGYAALVGVTFTPNVFCCGVSIVGISNLLTFAKTIPPYWKPDIALIKKRVGDFDTPEGRAFLKSRSPLTYADRIIKPLLILQGEHDPRVNKAEAEQIVYKMKQKDIPVTYVLYHNEGHGFSGEANQISSNAIIELFLAENLGGRAEPIYNDFKGANFSIVAGKQYIQGLKK
jgi:dipeptidyl aminopeptidase/acylaminoacyl peptidase